jgi:hypothetical protein
MPLRSYKDTAHFIFFCSFFQGPWRILIILMYLLFPVPPSGELLSSSAHKGLATPPAAALKGLTDPGPQLTSGLTFLFKKTTQDFPRFFFGTRSGFELVGRGRRV